MPRTTADQVKGIIDVPASEPLALTPFIDTANSIVTNLCLPSQTTNPTVYTNTLLELIERWLSAHFFAVNRRRTYQQDVGGAVGQTFDRAPLDLHLNSTMYGQTAQALDVDKNLAAFNNSLQDVKATGVRVTWLGREPSYPPVQ